MCFNKYYNKIFISFLIFFSLILFSGLQPSDVHALGESCPPCSAEQRILQDAARRLQNALDSLSLNGQDVNDYYKELIAKYLIDANIACSEAPDSRECTEAKSALENAINSLVSGGSVSLPQEIKRLADALKSALMRLDECQGRANPGMCKKCIAGTVQIDDSQDPGPCKQCKRGEIINADYENPGMCKKCSEGRIINDDSQDPGDCKRCYNGNVMSDDSKDPGRCKKCINGVVVNDFADDPGMCQKCSNGMAMPDDLEDPGLCQRCSGGKIVADNLEDPGPCLKCSGGFAVFDSSEPCDDGDPCTANDRCIGGECIGEPLTSNENPDCV